MRNSFYGEASPDVCSCALRVGGAARGCFRCRRCRLCRLAARRRCGAFKVELPLPTSKVLCCGGRLQFLTFDNTCCFSENIELFQCCTDMRIVRMSLHPCLHSLYSKSD